MESAIFDRLSTCETCRALQCACTAQLQDQRLVQVAQIIAQLQLAVQINTNEVYCPWLIQIREFE